MTAIRNKSFGNYQNYDDFSQTYDLAWEAQQGIRAADPNRFPLTKTGEYVGSQTNEMRQYGDQFGTQFDRNQKGYSPDMPHPRPQRRDDFEMEQQQRHKPRPF